MTEEQLWKGGTSHLTKIFHYLLAIVAAVAVFFLVQVIMKEPSISLIAGLIPLLYAFYVWLEVRSETFELTSERLRSSTGIFNKEVDELELYRIKDYKLESPFLIRIFGLANIVLITSDQTTPTVTMRAISDGQTLLNQIRAQVEKCRQTRGVREVDMA